MASVVALSRAWPANERLDERALAGVDLANQTLAPSCDRRNVTELWRVRIDRAYAELNIKGGQNG